MAVAMLLAGVGAAAAGESNGPRPGRIVVSNVYLLAKPGESVETLMTTMSRLQQPQPIHACCDGDTWRMHFAAWFDRPSGESTLELRFEAPPAPSADKRQPPRPLYTTTVPADAGSATVFVNDFVITTEQGFAAGRKYDVSLWRTSGLDGAPLATGSFILD